MTVEIIFPDLNEGSQSNGFFVLDAGKSKNRWDSYSISSETVSSSIWSASDDEDSTLGYDEGENHDDESTHAEPVSSFTSVPDFCPGRLTQMFHDLTIDELQDCLHLVQKHYGAEHPVTCQLWNVLGRRYLNHNSSEDETINQAQYCFRQALLASSTSSVQLAHAYYHLGQCHAIQHERQQAWEFFIRAAQAYEWVAGYEGKHRTYELGLIDDALAQL